MTSNGHSKHLTYSPDIIKKLPHRNQFCDQARAAQIKESVGRCSDVTFMPVDIVETSEEVTRTGGYREKQHVLYMFGILPDGSKAMVAVENCDVSFEIKVEKILPAQNTWDIYTDENRFRLSQEEFSSIIRMKFQENRLHYKSIAPSSGKDLKYFQPETRKWIKVSFANLMDRDKALKFVKKLEYTTAGDDSNPVYGARQGFYLPKIARESHFNAASWNDLIPGKYKVTRLGDHNHLSPKCNYVFRTDVNDLRATQEAKINADDLLTKDRIMVMTIDIETWRSKQGGEVPIAEDRDYCIFMICMTFHWKYTNAALAKFCIVDMPVKVTDDIFYDDAELLKMAKDMHAEENPSGEPFEDKHLKGYLDTVKSLHCDNNYVIECGNERNVLLALCDIIGQMSPDVTTAFNGANFDWSLIRERIFQIKSIQMPDGKLIDGMTYMKNKFSAIPKWGAERANSEQTPNEIYKQYFRKERVKVSAEKTNEMLCVLYFPGMIDTDLMVICEKLYPRAEVKRGKSLNYYLQKNGLQSKEDMPYKEMFRIYERARAWVRRDAEMNRGSMVPFIDYVPFGDNNDTRASIVDHENIIARVKALSKEKLDAAAIKRMKDSEKKIAEIRDAVKSGKIQPLSLAKNMTEIMAATDAHTKECNEFKEEMLYVAKYCVVDAYRCQQLFTKRTIIADNAEFANMSYVTLYEALYRANGVKVEQLVGKTCADSHANFNIKFSKINPKSIRMKYPGAFVFPPIKGLNTRRPVVGLDFASLYPSLEMAYNLSPDMVVEDEEQAASMAKQGYVMLPVNFSAEVTEEGDPNEGHVFPQRAWIVRHNGIIDPSVDKEVKGKDNNGEWLKRKEPLPGERMGIFPYILKDLFAHRKVIKTRLVALNNLKEQMIIAIKNNNLSENNKDWNILEDHLFKDTGLTKDMKFDVDEVDFRVAAVDSKQKGRKVHMNTFYGVQGYNKSTIYKLVVAGAITQYGQYNIQLVAKFCRDNGYTVWYGDTDSVYISSPEKIFTRLDAAFAAVEKFANNTISECEIDVRYKKKRKLGPDSNAGTDRVFDSRQIRKETTESAAKYFAEIIGDYKAAHEKLLDEMKKAGGHTKVPAFEKFTADNNDLFTKFCENMRLTLLAKVMEILETGPDDSDLLSAEYAKECMFLTKEEYWTQMVQVTRRDIDLFKTRVNDMLYEDNGTRFLNMAYEEVLFPVMFLGKKRYFGIPHLEGENFHPKASEYFIRGMEHIKQGQTQLAKDVSESFVKQVLSVRNEQDPFSIVKSEIKRIYNEKWPVNYFISRAKFKPEKKNIPVQRFVQRMRDAYAKYSNELDSLYNPELAAFYAPPDPGDPFEYVVVKKEQQFDLRGRKVSLGKGDCYEYVGVFKYFQDASIPMEIDLEHYMSGAMQGILGRFVTYREEFAVTDEEAQRLSEKEADERSMKRAAAWVREYCNKVAGIDASKTRNTGKALQKLFRAKEKINPTVLRNDLINRYGPVGELMSDIDIDHFLPQEDVQMRVNNNSLFDVSNKNVDKFMEEAEKKALSVPVYAKEYIETVRKRDEEGTKSFYDVWKQWRPDKVGGVESIFRQKMERCEKAEKEKFWQLRKIMPEYMNAVKRYDQKFNTAYEAMRMRILDNAGEDLESDLIKSANDLDDDVLALLKEVRKIYDDIVSIKMEKNKLSTISAAMGEEKFRRVKSNNQAPKMNPKEEAKSAKWVDVEDTEFN